MLKMNGVLDFLGSLDLEDLKQEKRYNEIPSHILIFSIIIGCQSVKEKQSAMADFFDAVASGDIKILKKYKAMKNDEESWEEVE